ncbi:ABC transporter ATP-binding protein [Desertimonas flava]|uniref:ABC transporter ATP-binding protein n=1 Tax=Desertimonas flava TaxID=2064846 RepID=UPI000E353DFC|nr:ABC transporter ATP-binding protein [Desertimonas flava]
MSEPLLTIDDLVVEFTGPRRMFVGPRPVFRAVDGVSLTIDRGETLGLVGESGSGKTTTGRAVLGLVTPTSGRIDFEGHDIAGIAPTDRGRIIRNLQVVFQNPYSSLNPALTVRTILDEAVSVAADGPDGRDAERLLELVGLDRTHADRYPHQFSGGQRQRIAIARALAVNPRLVVCDEPVSALDVSTRGQIINLLEDLREEFAMAYLFIAHDLTIVRHLSHRIAVMFRGQLMEVGDADAVASEPAHPYTRSLVAAVPVPDPARQRQRRTERARLIASGPAGAVGPGGCPFRGRCPQAHDTCETVRPVMRPAPHGGTVACHLYPAEEGATDR